MPYTFIYDLTRISQSVFGQVFDAACGIGLHKYIGLNAKKLVKIFKIDEATGLNFSEAITHHTASSSVSQSLSLSGLSEFLRVVARCCRVWSTTSKLRLQGDQVVVVQPRNRRTATSSEIRRWRLLSSSRKKPVDDDK